LEISIFPQYYCLRGSGARQRERSGVNTVPKEASTNPTGGRPTGTNIQGCLLYRKGAMSLYISMMLLGYRLPLGKTYDLNQSSYFQLRKTSEEG
jgi:hypothetical protein